MTILENISLKPYNTFGIEVFAKRFVEANSITDLKQIISKHKDIFILNGGSNLLLTKDIQKLVVHLHLKGITSTNYDDASVLVTAQAGENWHDFVLWCISKNYGGLENLSYIPGNVGSSPIQNIGAYGVEIKDTFYELEALEIATGNVVTFTKNDCNFGYRNSVFKNELKGKYIITQVTFKLTKAHHAINISYGAILNDLTNKQHPTLQEISDVIIAIRKSKLPEPQEIGNSGSFFKNPVITTDLFKKLQKKHPNIPFYTVSEEEVKIPAGWLIEQSGFKGKRFGDAGVHQNQALVLVNYGNATGEEIYNLAKKIQQTIWQNFSISLEIEVNVV